MEPQCRDTPERAKSRLVLAVSCLIGVHVKVSDVREVVLGPIRGPKGRDVTQCAGQDREELELRGAFRVPGGAARLDLTVQSCTALQQFPIRRGFWPWLKQRPRGERREHPWAGCLGLG